MLRLCFCLFLVSLTVGEFNSRDEVQTWFNGFGKMFPGVLKNGDLTEFVNEGFSENAVVMGNEIVATGRENIATFLSNLKIVEWFGHYDVLYWHSNRAICNIAYTYTKK